MPFVVTQRTAPQRLALTVSDRNGALVQPNDARSVTVTATERTGIDRLDELVDVEEGTPANGYVLTYRASDDKWVPTAPGSVGDIDGGTF